VRALSLTLEAAVDRDELEEVEEEPQPAITESGWDTRTLFLSGTTSSSEDDSTEELSRSVPSWGSVPASDFIPVPERRGGKWEVIY
jgi:hypothetical protein